MCSAFNLYQYLMEKEKFKARETYPVIQNEFNFSKRSIEVKTFYCYHCNYHCQLKSFIVKHIKKHLKEKTVTVSKRCPKQLKIFYCYHCTFTTGFKCKLLTHMRRHTGERPYFCTLCSYRANRSDLLKDHVLRHLGASHYKERNSGNGCVLLRCKECDYTSYKKYAIKKHTISKHSKERPFPCNYCCYASKKACDLKKHMLTHMRKDLIKGNVDQKYQCKLCDSIAENYSSFIDHISQQHPTKLNSCPYCLFKTTISADLKRHLMGHNGEKFSCTHCNYSTLVQSHLKRHFMIHTGEKPFSCTHCEYKTRYGYVLRAHLESHYVKRRVFNCIICGFSTGERNLFKKHLLIHGNKGFVCAVCEYTTNTAKDLTKHNELAHVKEENLLF